MNWSFVEKVNKKEMYQKKVRIYLWEKVGEMVFEQISSL